MSVIQSYRGLGNGHQQLPNDRGLTNGWERETWKVFVWNKWSCKEAHTHTHTWDHEHAYHGNTYTRVVKMHTCGVIGTYTCHMYTYTHVSHVHIHTCHMYTYTRVSHILTQSVTSTNTRTCHINKHTHTCHVNLFSSPMYVLAHTCLMYWHTRVTCTLTLIHVWYVLKHAHTRVNCARTRLETYTCHMYTYTKWHTHTRRCATLWTTIGGHELEKGVISSWSSKPNRNG